MISCGALNSTRLLEYEEELKKLDYEYSFTKTLIANLEERQSAMKFFMQQRGEKLPTAAEINAIIEMIATTGTSVAKQLTELQIREARKPICSENFLLKTALIAVRLELKLDKEVLEEKINAEKNKGRDVEDHVVSIILSRDASKSGDVDETLTIKYLVSSAQWNPVYSIYYKPDDGLAQLEYYAEILQHTGFDFDNVWIYILFLNWLKFSSGSNYTSYCSFYGSRTNS